eukprot:scaffold4674_cov188-Amphora_coffeaeformis.AAC.2
MPQRRSLETTVYETSLCRVYISKTKEVDGFGLASWRASHSFVRVAGGAPRPKTARVWFKIRNIKPSTHTHAHKIMKPEEKSNQAITLFDPEKTPSTAHNQRLHCSRYYSEKEAP